MVLLVVINFSIWLMSTEVFHRLISSIVLAIDWILNMTDAIYWLVVLCVQRYLYSSTNSTCCNLLLFFFLNSAWSSVNLGIYIFNWMESTTRGIIIWRWIFGHYKGKLSFCLILIPIIAYAFEFIDAKKILFMLLVFVIIMF